MSSANHDYHLVQPSPWPAWGALSAFVTFAGILIFLNPGIFGEGMRTGLTHLGLAALVPGPMMLLGTCYLWWKDVVTEAQGGDHKPIVQLGLRYGMALFIISEIFFFFSFFWAYFDAALFTDEVEQIARQAHTGSVWPPAGVKTFDPFDLPFLNTLILLTSGCTVTWAHHALRENNRKAVIQGLSLTVALGIIFSFVQAYEYSHAAFGLSDGIYASTFYIATGFHGFHVIVGTIFLAVCLFRAMKGHFTPTQHFGFEAAAWYWHFVDVVWIFLFIWIYWWGA